MRWGHTHICLVKQLLCLYPFPQRSQRSSPATRFPSPRIRCDPSLARRLRFLVLTGFPTEAPPSTAVLFPSVVADCGECLRPTAWSLTLRER